MTIVKKSDIIHFSPRLVLVGGPSGVGKTTAINQLTCIEDNRYSRPLSYTSRPKRPGETGSEFVFVNRDEILEMEASGEILTVDEAYGNLYGISADSVYGLLDQGIVPIKEVHPANHKKLKRLFGDAVSAMVIPLNDIYNDDKAEGGRKRIEEDRHYYSQVNLLESDIVIHTDHSYPPGNLAANLDLSIQALLSTSHIFPYPSVIDITNLQGYSIAAPEFLEERRVTTRNFHQLSCAFFRTIIRERIAKGARCLEIGPGQGWLRRSFDWPDVDYTGVDISAEMLKQTDCSGICSSARVLRFPDRYFDLVIASLADPYCYAVALCEIRRVLKEDGLFIFSSPSRIWSEGLRSEHQRMKTRFLLDGGASAEVFSFTFSSDELTELLRRCGFSVEEITEAYGSELDPDDSVSSAIISSADNLGTKISELPILNLVIAGRAQQYTKVPGFPTGVTKGGWH